MSRINPPTSGETLVRVKSLDGSVRTSQKSNVLTLKTVSGDLVNTSFRQNSSVGIQGADNPVLVKTVVKDLFIPPERLEELQFYDKPDKLMGIIGFKNSQFLISSKDPAELGLKLNNS